MKQASRSIRILTVLAIAGAQVAMAWGPEGHRVVGALALDHMQPEPRTALEQVVGTTDQEALTAWCNWPDEYRETEMGKWSTPLHYINMVPGESHYQRERDCAEGLCVTEAIRTYAAQLADVTLPDRSRREAFGFVCHFVGDLSQPLHAGFGEDRGGNNFKINYNGAESDLHTFWDHDLIEEHTDSWSELYDMVRKLPYEADAQPWSPDEIVEWTNRSHAIAAGCVYPDQPDITEEFAVKTWEHIQKQLLVGGGNLARVLDAALAVTPQRSP